MLDPNARPVEDEPLREEDVTAGDRLDDRVSEGEGLPGEVGDGEPYPEIKRKGGDA